ncbi:MAG: hypothetical protein JWL72_762, partial [Ilumatobacteraceae bacterium]|nr:hypothetical protein [Ilumatobacteraceae bacterium]
DEVTAPETERDVVAEADPAAGVLDDPEPPR